MTISDSELFEKFPDVWINRDNVEYFRGLCDHKLLFNRCRSCGYWIYPHQAMCPECWSWDVAFEPVTGRGKVYMYTLVHQARTVEEGFYVEPFPSVAVELDEQPGLRYLSTTFDGPTNEIHVGRRVEMAWISREGMPTPAFRIVDEDRARGGGGKS